MSSSSMAAATDFQFPPRFFKVFVAHFSSDSMVIPVSYYDQLPRLLPKKVILQGPGGCSWDVATKIRGDEVHFAQRWPKFVDDNTLNDGDFLTFVYNGDHILRSVSTAAMDVKRLAKSLKWKRTKETE